MRPEVRLCLISEHFGHCPWSAFVQHFALQQFIELLKQSGGVPGKPAGKRQNVGAVIGPEDCARKVKS
jgi:hypothetical protein